MGVTAKGGPRHWWSVPPAPSPVLTIGTRRAYGEVLAVFGVFFASGVAAAGFSVAGQQPDASVGGWARALPAAINQFAVTALCVAVPLLLAARRGLSRNDVGLAVAGKVTLRSGTRMAAWAVLALLAGGVVTGLLATGRLPLGLWSYPGLVLNLSHATQAGFIEEVVVLAFVVTTLEQARRPRPEIVAVALILRASYHIYYGPGVAGIALWAAVFVWLYLRFRTVVPLIAVHSAWDVLVVLGDRWRGATGFLGLAIVGLVLTAIVMWLVDRAEGQRPAPVLAVPPGWYVGPGRSAALRWFDGRQWGPLGTSSPPAPAPTWWEPSPPAGPAPPGI